MATHPQVNEAARKAIERCGTSVSASRLLSGSRPLHLELEAELAATLGCEAAITLVNGHATNVTVIGHLVGEGDLIVHDSLAHDSIIQGCRLSARAAALPAQRRGRPGRPPHPGPPPLPPRPGRRRGRLQHGR
ncbi:hypothetical protein SAV31267_098920 [Streptomyces avermitilis]|uniref:8-amino-7-oxononanoate synthase n=1 Tax=Streptomyces avermitilis TaxID=33903 RepID=A0A4D4NB50_STRAX|nr:hypothetical protein SAV31267_098920 [Streptomyces avermitilis]